MELSKHERIEKRKLEVGSRHGRKLKNFSPNFNKMFSFFFQVNRKGLITFCGQQIEVHFDAKKECAKETFRKFEDGHFNKGQKIVTRHPNVLHAVLVGKKGWGLWKDEWAQGIAECSFTKSEILEEFSKNNVDIPDAMMKEFNDFIWKESFKRNKIVS